MSCRTRHGDVLQDKARGYVLQDKAQGYVLQDKAQGDMSCKTRHENIETSKCTMCMALCLCK